MMTIVVSNPWWFARTRCLLASNWNPLYVRISAKTGLFHREFCGLSRLCLPRMQRRVSFVTKPCLVGYFLCSNTIVHLLLPPRGYFLPLFATSSRWPPHTRAAVEATAALKLNNRHSTYATAVDSGNSRNNDDTQDTNIFLTISLSARTSHFMR